MKIRKIILTMFLVSFLVVNVAAQDPRHPLSQIYPIDVDLEMEAQDIRNVSQLQLNDGVGNQGLKLEGYTLTDEGEAQKFVLDYQNDEWDIENSNLNMNGNNITEIDTLHFVSGASINGSLNTSGGNVNLENGSITDAYSIDGGGDAVNFFDAIDMNGNIITDSNGALELDGNIYVPTGSLDMAGNDIINPGNVDGIDLDNPGNGIDVTDSRYQIIEDAIGNSELNNSQEFTADGLILTSNLNMTGNDIETGGNDIAVVDTANGQDITRFREGGIVEIPNGRLDVQENKIANFAFFEGRAGTSQEFVAMPGGGYEFRTQGGANPALGISDNGDIQIPEGNLNLKVSGQDAGNNITNVDTLTGRDTLNLAGEGSSQGVILEHGDGTPVLEAGLSDNDVAVPNGGLEINNPSNTDNTVDVGGSVGIENVLDMNQNNIETVDSLVGTSNSPLELSVSGSGGSELVLDNSGDVQVQNGALDLRGNSLVDTTSSNTVYIGDGNNDTVVMDAPGNVEFEGDLDLSSDSIINYYDSACPQGETVVDIQDDGTFQCMDVAEEVADIYVNRSGDTMTGDLNMLGNQVNNVSRLGVGTASPQENLDVDGTASIENSGTRMEVDSSGDVVVTLGS